MNTKTAFVFFFLVSSSCAYAQQDTLYLDSLSGNYVIQYRAHFRFVEDSAGLHPYDMDMTLHSGQKIVRRDSIVTVIFEPATKIDPSVLCTITREKKNGPYVYSYRVENGIKSRQPLNEFSVEFGKGVEVTNQTPEDGWHNIRANDVKGGDLDPGNRWHWWGDIGLEPGRGWTVGRLSSNGLPAIMRVYFGGKTKSPVFPGRGPDYDLEARITELAGFPGDYVTGWSLGPAPVPTPLIYELFVDSLLTYRQHCSLLGWILSDSVAKSMDGKLRIVKRDVAGKKYAAAVAVLQSLLRELDFHRSRSVLEDAYALFKYNAEYLSDRLAGSR